MPCLRLKTSRYTSNPLSYYANLTNHIRSCMPCTPCMSIANFHYRKHFVVNGNQHILLQRAEVCVRTTCKVKPHSTPSTLSWLERNYEMADGVCVPRNAIYMHYVDFCSQNAMQPVNAASFGKILRQQFPQLTTRRLGTRGQSRYHYYGIAIKEESPYYEIMYSKKGILNCEHTEPRRELIARQMPPLMRRPTESSDIANFPDFRGVKLPPNVTVERANKLAFMYKTHCLNIYMIVVNSHISDVSIRCQQVEERVRNFWRGIPEHLQDLLEIDAVVTMFGVWDSHFYMALAKAVMLLLIQDWQNLFQMLAQYLIQRQLIYSATARFSYKAVFGHLPQIAVTAAFAKEYTNWLSESLNNIPENLRKLKIDQAHSLSMALQRIVELSDVTHTTRTLLHNSERVIEMQTEWDKINFNAIKSDISYTLMGMFNRDDDQVTTFFNSMCSACKDVLRKDPSNIEGARKWAECKIREMNANLASCEVLERGRTFLLGWSFFFSRVTWEISTNACAAFIPMHLIFLTMSEFASFYSELACTKEYAEAMLRNVLSPHPSLMPTTWRNCTPSEIPRNDASPSTATILSQTLPSTSSALSRAMPSTYNAFSRTIPFTLDDLSRAMPTSINPSQSGSLPSSAPFRVMPSTLTALSRALLAAPIEPSKATPALSAETTVQPRTLASDIHCLTMSAGSNGPIESQREPSRVRTSPILTKINSNLHPPFMKAAPSLLSLFRQPRTLSSNQLPIISQGEEKQLERKMQNQLQAYHHALQPMPTLIERPQQVPQQHQDLMSKPEHNAMSRFPSPFYARNKHLCTISREINPYFERPPPAETPIPRSPGLMSSASGQQHNNDTIPNVSVIQRNIRSENIHSESNVATNTFDDREAYTLPVTHETPNDEVPQSNSSIYLNSSVSLPPASGNFDPNFTFNYVSGSSQFNNLGSFIHQDSTNLNINPTNIPDYNQGLGTSSTSMDQGVPVPCGSRIDTSYYSYRSHEITYRPMRYHYHPYQQFRSNINIDQGLADLSTEDDSAVISHDLSADMALPPLSVNIPALTLSQRTGSHLQVQQFPDTTYGLLSCTRNTATTSAASSSTITTTTNISSASSSVSHGLHQQDIAYHHEQQSNAPTSSSAMYYTQPPEPFFNENPNSPHSYQQQPRTFRLLEDHKEMNAVTVVTEMLKSKGSKDEEEEEEEDSYEDDSEDDSTDERNNQDAEPFGLENSFQQQQI